MLFGTFKAVLLGKITGIPKAPNYEIWSVWHLSFVQKLSFSSQLKKVSRLWSLGTAKAQSLDF